MATLRTGESQDIKAALRKLRDKSNEKEVELIELVASIYESLKEQQEKVVDKVEDTATGINTSVHLHPWRYIGGAALCGFLVGLVVRR